MFKGIKKTDKNADENNAPIEEVPGSPEAQVDKGATREIIIDLFRDEYNALCNKYKLKIAPEMFFQQQIDSTCTIGARLKIVST